MTLCEAGLEYVALEYFLLTLLIAIENGNVAKARPQAQSRVDTLSGPICHWQASVKEMSKAMKTTMRTRTRTEDVHKMVHHSRNAKTFRHVISVLIHQ